jgi:hypothetical protein
LDGAQTPSATRRVMAGNGALWGCRPSPARFSENRFGKALSAAAKTAAAGRFLGSFHPLRLPPAASFSQPLPIFPMNSGIHQECREKPAAGYRTLMNPNRVLKVTFQYTR